jgi:uncharacterized protein (DUF58 family)
MRLSVRPTWFGVTLVAFVVAGGLLAPAAADPEVAGLAGAALVALVVIGALWPVAHVVSTRVAVLGSPSDVTVGDAVDLVLDVRGWAGPVEARLRESAPTSHHPWQWIDVADCVTLRSLAPRRGVVDEVEIDVRTVAPLGVARARRTFRCRLPATMWIAPSPTDEQLEQASATAHHGDGPTVAGSLVGDVVRSVRPYQPGDPPNLVHWPSTARAGDLMVRELEPPAERGLAIVVHLGEEQARADALASRAAGIVWAVHAAGGRIVLCTHEGAAGPRAVAVPTTTDAGRQLAAATPGAPAAPPPGWPVVVVGP